MENDLAKRYQTLLVLWFAMLMSIVVYFIVLLIAGPELSNDRGSRPSSLLKFAPSAFGFLLILFSDLVKRRFLKLSVDRQDASMVQKGLVLAWAMCEVCALIGLLERFLIPNGGYYLFLMAAGAIALHFPRRTQLEAASFKSRNNLT